jgi:hypothetical protein
MFDAALDTGLIHAERRRSTRPRALKGAHLRFNNGYGAYEAVIRDLTPGGARLRFGDFVDVPAEFEMRIVGEETIRRARVAWRQNYEIGITFLP